MEFPDSYYEDEVRCGFFVPALMKRCWAAQMTVLEYIDDLCARHGITWFADCGTLLGAIRHNGSIPWDDDFDIAMKREDFNRFNEIALKEVDKPFFLMNFEKNAYWETMTRITNGDVINYDYKHLRKFNGFPYPAGIDIFPLDYVPPEEDAEIIREIMRIIYKVFNQTGLLFEDDDEDAPFNEIKDADPDILAAFNRDLVRIEDLTKQSIDRNAPLRRQLFEILERVISLYSEEESRYVAIAHVWIDSDRNKVPKEFYDGNVVEVPFETTTIKVPAAYDAILKSKYGDYMKLVKAWDFHAYPIYDKQYQTMVDAGVGPRRYSYKESELANPDRELLRKPRQKVEAFLAMLPQVHEGLIQSIANGDVEGACGLLEDLQNGMIQMGGLLEESEGEDCQVVRLFEHYCELIYTLFSFLTGEEEHSMEEVEALVRKMGETVEEAQEGCRTRLKDKHKVVFLVSRLKAWPFLENLWKKEKENPNQEVYVVPIQFMYKKPEGSVKAVCFEADRLPSYVELTDIDNMNLEALHPDVIYTHDYFAVENETVTIHPFFYTSNIKKLCEKVIYVPPFKVDEYDERDGRSCRIMQDYVCMPGVVHADEVHVMSDKTREGYITTLVNWAGEETRAIWEDKIIADPDAYEGVEGRIHYELPEDLKKYIELPDGSRKKVILFSNGTSTMLEYKEKMLDKLKRVLETFKEASDKLTLIWRPHPMMRNAIMAEEPEIWKEYCEIVEQYKKEGWGILDEGRDLATMVGISDAYYGDTGAIPQRFREAKKPVMLLSVEV